MGARRGPQGPGTPGIRLSKQPKPGRVTNIAGGDRQREALRVIPVYSKRATPKPVESIEAKQEIEIKAGK